MTLTAVAFVLFYLFGLLKAFTTHPRWGLYTYIATFYLHPPMRWWGQSLPDLRWSLMAALVTLLAMPSAKLPPNASPWTSYALSKIILAYVTWMWIQTPWANPSHFEGLLLMTKYAALFFLFYRLIRTVDDLVEFALAHLAGCFYFGMLALEARGGGRLEYIGGPGTNDSNTLGMHMSTGLIFAGALLLTQRGWRRWAAALTVPVLANTIVQTQSRGAFLGAACGALVYYLFSPKKQRKFIVVLGFLSVSILLAYAPTEFWDRMSTIGKAAKQSEETDNSAKSRFVIADAQWKMFLDHPLGLGFDTTTYLSRHYLDVQWLTARPGRDRKLYGARSSHNTLLTVLTDQGLPGILLALSGIGVVLATMRRLKKNLAHDKDDVLRSMTGAICGSLTVSFVAGMFANYMKAEIQLWCLAVLLVCVELVRGAPDLRSAAAAAVPGPSTPPGSLSPVNRNTG